MDEKILNNENMVEISEQELDEVSGGRRNLNNQPVYYTVQRGDTLMKIANKFGVTVGALCQINVLRNVNKLPIGMQIRVR